VTGVRAYGPENSAIEEVLPRPVAITAMKKARELVLVFISFTVRLTAYYHIAMWLSPMIDEERNWSFYPAITLDACPLAEGLLGRNRRHSIDWQ